jgi:hypothetical protein
MKLPTLKWPPSRKWRIILGIVILLVAIRIALPFIIKWYLNEKVLSDLGEYYGHIEDVDLALIRGAYTIDRMVIIKKGSKVEEPFAFFPEIDLSLEWKAIFKGRLVGEVILFSPTVNFAFDSQKSQSQTGVEENWVDLAKAFMPVQINRFGVVNGEIAMVNLFAGTDSEVSLKDFDLAITNIRNVDAEDTALPSDINATCQAPDYSGQFKFNAKANLLREIPNFDYNAEFTGIDMTSLNPIVKHYAGVDFEKGKLDLFSEMVMKDSTYDGYFKPLAHDMTIFRLDEDDPKGDKRSVGQFFKELLFEGGQEIFENQPRQLFATRVPIQGSVGNPENDVWTIIIQAFINAYIEAFQAQLDFSVKYNE